MGPRKIIAAGMIFLFLTSSFAISLYFALQNPSNHGSEQNRSNGSSNFLFVQESPKNSFELNSNLDPDFAPLRIVTFVGATSGQYDKDLVYLAAIPTALFNESGIRKISPVLYDDLNLASKSFLTDWKNYCNKFGTWNGIKNIVYIGNISAQTKSKAETLLNPEGKFDFDMSPPVHITGSNTFEIAANIANYFWYKQDTVVLAPIDYSFPAPQIKSISYSGSLTSVGSINKLGEINNSFPSNFWSKMNVTTLNSGGIYVKIDNTNDLAMELFGNFTKQSKWMYDTNNISKTDWVFFPNVTYPADLTDWGVRIYNRFPIVTSIPYGLTFYNLPYAKYQFQINNSESQFDVFLNWSDSNEDLNFWVLDPSNQLIEASSREGNLYEIGNINKSSRVLYPQNGTWTVLVTRSMGSQPVPYNLTINVTTFSSNRSKSIQSASNGAVIASMMNKPLLYITKDSVPTATSNALSRLAVKKYILVDPFNLVNKSVFNALSNLGILLSQSTNLSSTIQVNNYIYTRSHEPDIVISSINNGYFAPASLLAAFHGAPLVFSLNQTYNIHAGAIKNYAVDYWVGFQNPGDSNKLHQNLPRFLDMKTVADIFYGWLNSMNLDRSGNETVLIVSPLWELNPLFDRAIYGKAFAGRFEGENTGELASFICRNILYPALVYSNLSYSYESQAKNVAAMGNSTKTSKQLNATSFSGSVANTVANDGAYHSYVNGSNGRIVMAYYVNLTDARILYNNITKVQISIDGKLGYSNSLIKVAGWGIWNWTAGNYKLIDNNVLNSTSDRSDEILITTANKSNFISPTNARIEIFILINTTGASVRAYIDYIAFNVTYNQIFNYPKMLASSITYWHDFAFAGNDYNFSSLIPMNFTQKGYQVQNKTGYLNIYAQLASNCKVWYYSGTSTLPASEFGQQGNILFTQNNYWRAFGDYDDTLASEENPDQDGDHFVTPTAAAEKWQSGTTFNSSLPYLHSSFVLLQSSYLGVTQIPEYLTSHGAAVVIADLKQSVVGYSEYFAYRTLNELLKGKSVGASLYKAYNQTGHLYARNWQGMIVELAPFSSYTEDNQQFILFGDPDLVLLNRTFNPPRPTDYRPLIHEFIYNVTRADPDYVTPYHVGLWANITDLDSDLKQEVSGSFNISGDGFAGFKRYHTNIPLDYDEFALPPKPKFWGYTTFFNDTEPFYQWESLGNKTLHWKVWDSNNVILVTSAIMLRTSPPRILLSKSRTCINDTGIYHDIDHKTDVFDLDVYEEIGRVNESLLVNFTIRDWDQELGKDGWEEFNMTLILKNLNSSSTFSFPMEFISDGDPDDPYSSWSKEYHFDAFKPTGMYKIFLYVKDYYNATEENLFTGADMELPYTPLYQWFNLINWPAQKNGTNFFTMNATGSTYRIFRVNETLQVTASVFDIDGNQTHINAASLCFRKGISGWINVSMSDPNLDNQWNTTYKFTPNNDIGVWTLYIKATDKDNKVALINSSTYLTVANIPPNAPSNLMMKNGTLMQTSAVFRNETISFFANATDLDVSDRITRLTLTACLKGPDGKIKYQNLTMTYNTTAALWLYRFTPKLTDPVGNWTYYVSVRDETGSVTNSTEKLILRIKNNMPVIKTVTVFPPAIGDTLSLTIGETLSIRGTAIDVEQLVKIQVFIKDSTGKCINRSQTLSGKSSVFNFEFSEAYYSGLKQEGAWNITLKLFDSDGNFTNAFTFNSQQNVITIIVSPASHNGEQRFPYEILIIVGIVVTTVLATYLVYRTRKKEATVIPATRVKQIIKKISKEKEEETVRAREAIKLRTTAAIVPEPVKGPITPVEKPELTEEEKEAINRQLQDLVKTAQNLLDEDQYDKAALAYHDAAKLATKLDKHEMARVYSDKGEEILVKKAELRKMKKVKEVEKKREVEKKKKSEKLLGKAKIESIKAEIGETMWSARKALREDDFMAAAKYYKEVARLYRELFDEENAKYFEAKANELL